MARPAFQDPGAAAHAFAITPNDSADLAERTRGIYVGVTGDVVAVMAEHGTTVTFKAMAAGVIHPIAAIRVKSTGTTATDLVGML